MHVILLFCVKRYRLVFAFLCISLHKTLIHVVLLLVSCPPPHGNKTELIRTIRCTFDNFQAHTLVAALSLDQALSVTLPLLISIHVAPPPH
jgi:hypothetical protein